MKRQPFTIAIFAALLLGCAASAMPLGAPRTVDASMGQSHAKPIVVTGPCYRSGGSNCPTDFHFVHDNQMETAEDTGGCNGCTLSPALSFTGSAAFTNPYYDCHGILLDYLGSGYCRYGVILFTADSATSGSGSGAASRSETKPVQQFQRTPSCESLIHARAARDSERASACNTGSSS
jgi:hypothetical protein